MGELPDCAACRAPKADFFGDGGVALCHPCFEAQQARTEGLAIATQMIGGGIAAMFMGVLGGIVMVFCFPPLGALGGLLAAAGAASFWQGRKKRSELLDPR